MNFNLRALFGQNSEKRGQDIVNEDYLKDLTLNYGRFSFQGGNTSLSVIFAATELISNAIAQMPIYVNNKEDKNTVYNHPVMLALQEGQISRFMLIKNLIKDVYLSGNGFIYIKRTAGGIVSDLIYLHPGQCQIMYNDQSRELYYIAPSVSNKKIFPHDMIHLCKNTVDGVIGKSVTSFASRTIKLADYTESAASNYYSQGCNINGVVKSAKILTDQQKKDIKNNWYNTFGGSSTTAGGICVLGADMDYTPIGTNASNAQLIESRKYNLTELCRYFNISPYLLGFTEGTSYNSLEYAQLEFLTHTLQPIIVLLEEELNRKLFSPAERDVYYIEIDETVLLRSDKKTEANYYQTLVGSGILSINEAREALGYGPIEGGDENLIPYTNINSNKIDQTNNNKEVEENEENNSEENK